MGDDLNCSRRAGRGVRSPLVNSFNCFNDLLRGQPPASWLPVPYLKHYWNMPLASESGFMDAPFQLVIVNKYEREWRIGPVNYLDFSMIRSLVDEFRSTCGDKARVLYSRVQHAAPGEAHDRQQDYVLRDNTSQLSDFDLMRSRSHVTTIQDYFAAYPGL